MLEAAGEVQGRERKSKRKNTSERAHPVRVAGFKTFGLDQYPGPILACRILASHGSDIRSSSQTR